MRVEKRNVSRIFEKFHEHFHDLTWDGEPNKKESNSSKFKDIGIQTIQLQGYSHV